MIKVAHFAEFGPRQCGLYHTAKDLVLAERSIGMDARFVAVDVEGKVSVHRDGSFETEKLDWAYGADLLVRHTAIPGHIQCSGKPIVMCLHGRPESSLRLEQQKKVEVITGMANKANDCRYKKFVTFWPEYVDIWRSLVGNKIEYVPACVNLDEWRPTKRLGIPNILIADIWREDVTPFNVIMAAQRFCRLNPSARLYIVGMPQNVFHPMRHLLADMGNSLVEVRGQTKDMAKYYELADMVVTPHVIATRIIRESLACDVPIVAGEGCQYTPYTASSLDVNAIHAAMAECWQDRPYVRPVAESHFGFTKAGEAMQRICQRLIRPRRNGKRKVCVDIGAHIGETVRRFYREKPDAHEYEIYCFEPERATFTQLDRNIGHIPNVNLLPCCAGATDGLVDFYPGAVNCNEGGTTVTGKQTGGVRYDKPIKVESLDFIRWLKANHGDYTIVKMNIEGGEYDLMERLLDAGCTGLINRLYVQLHAHKFEHGEQRQRFQRIEAAFFNNAECKCYFTNKGFHAFGN